MFSLGGGVVASPNDISGAQNVLAVVTDPAKAKAALEELTAKIEEINVKNDAAITAHREANVAMTAAQETRAVVESLAKEVNGRIAGVEAAAARVAQQEAVLTQRAADLDRSIENAGARHAAAKSKLDQRTVDLARKEQEADVAIAEKDKQAAAARDAAEALITKRTAQLETTLLQATQDAQAAADLKAKWEAKVKQINEIATAA